MQLVLDPSQYLIDKRFDDGTRERAASDLDMLGHQYAIPALVAVLRDETDVPQVRQRCIRALRMIRDKRAVVHLIDDALGSEHRQLVRDAMWDLTEFAGRPPKLADPSFVGGIKPPPEDPEQRSEYFKTWHDWWDKVKDDAELTRMNVGDN